MNINSKETLYGLPILTIREILRHSMQERLFGNNKSEINEKIAKLIKKSSLDANELTNALIDDDYLFLKEEKFNNVSQYEFVATEKGRRLGLATATPPIPRKKADKMLTDLIERAKTINQNPDLVYIVESIKVFGSYLSEKETLGDLDVAIKMTRRYAGEDFSEHNQKRIEHAQENGKNFRSFVDALAWPHTEVMTMLQGRKKGLSIHDEQHDDVLQVTEFKLIYEFPWEINTPESDLPF